MTHEEYKSAADFWNMQPRKEMPEDELRQYVNAYISANDVCALATGYGDYVRCTPLEYSYRDGCFWIFTEGGEKFIGLEKNENVCLAIFDSNISFHDLKSVQVMGRARVVEPMSEEYILQAKAKNIPLDALQKLIDRGRVMHLICIVPTKIESLFSCFKSQGYDSRQTLLFKQSKAL